MLKNRRFIGKFVNGVYGILLGFGFCNVVKDIIDDSAGDQVWLVTHIVMSIFIIIVVCLYWWDWSENIESQVESTFLEFTIDILILFTLEFLFFLFANPIGLAILFLALSILNFAWVLNFLWEKHKNNFNSKGYLKNTGDLRYILQKIYSIFIFGFSLFLVYRINLYFDPDSASLSFAQNDLAYISCGLVLIIFFIINRYIAFSNRPLD